MSTRPDSQQSTLHRYIHSPEHATIERFQNADKYAIYRNGRRLTGTHDTKYDAHRVAERKNIWGDGEESDDNYTVQYTPITRLVLSVGNERLLATLQPESNFPPEPNDFITELLNTKIREPECIINRETATTGSLEFEGETIDINYEEATQRKEYIPDFHHARSTELPKWYDYLNTCDDDGWITATLDQLKTKTTGLIFKDTTLTQIETTRPHGYYIRFNLNESLESTQVDHLKEAEIRIRAKIFSEPAPYKYTPYGEETEDPYIDSEYDEWELDPESLPL